MLIFIPQSVEDNFLYHLLCEILFTFCSKKSSPLSPLCSMDTLAKHAPGRETLSHPQEISHSAVCRQNRRNPSETSHRNPTVVSLTKTAPPHLWMKSRALNTLWVAHLSDTLETPTKLKECAELITSEPIFVYECEFHIVQNTPQCTAFKMCVGACMRVSVCDLGGHSTFQPKKSYHFYKIVFSFSIISHCLFSINVLGQE